MSSQVIELGNVAFLGKSKSVVKIAGTGSAVKKTAGKGATSITDSSNYLPYVPWGDDNLKPQQMISDIKSIPSLSGALNFKSKLIYSNGPMAFKRKVENGTEIITPVDDANFKEFMRRPANKKFFRDASFAMQYFYNLFPEILLNKAGNKILQLRSLQPTYCRLGVQSKTKGYSDKIFYSANWESSQEPDDEVPVLDPIDMLGDLQQRKDSYNYVLPSLVPILDNCYYADAGWLSAKEAGWIDIVKNVPLFKKALFENLKSIRWHIKIPSDYWGTIYKGYDNQSDIKKKEIRQGVLDEMDDYLSGAKNAGKAFISHFTVDKSGKAMDGWSIEALDDKIKDGAYIPDGNQANQEIFFASSMDASLVGSQLSGDGKMGARTGGSDKREAWMIAAALSRFDRDIILEPLYLIRDYNGWDADLEFGFRDIVFQTLDKNPTGQNNATS